jgi:hypothetical protein
MCHVTGFLPYFYIPAPIGFQRQQLQPLQVAIEVTVIPLLPFLPTTIFGYADSVFVESRFTRTTSDPSYRNLNERESMGLQRQSKNPLPKNNPQ